MMARMVAVEGLVLVEKVPFCNEAAVDVAVLEVNGCLSFMLNMFDFFSSPRAEGSMIYQELPMAENHPAALKGRMSLWLTV